MVRLLIPYGMCDKNSQVRRGPAKNIALGHEDRMGRGPQGAPRKTGGGRSDRYDERRNARSVTREYAPGWSDAASRALSAALKDSAIKKGKSLGRHLAWVFSSRERSETLARKAGVAVGAHDRQNLADVLLWRRRRVWSRAAGAHGRGTRTRTLTRRPAKNGSFCCLTGGTSTLSTPGASMRASWRLRGRRSRRQGRLRSMTRRRTWTTCDGRRVVKNLKVW